MDGPVPPTTNSSSLFSLESRSTSVKCPSLFYGHLTVWVAIDLRFRCRKGARLLSQAYPCPNIVELLRLGRIRHPLTRSVTW